MTLLPPFWFLGAHETLAGGFVDGFRARTCHRRWAAPEERATATIAPRCLRFTALALQALIAFVGHDPGAVGLHVEQPAAAVPAGRHPRRSLRGAGSAGAPGHADTSSRDAGHTRRLLLHRAVPGAEARRTGWCWPDARRSRWRWRPPPSRTRSRVSFDPRAPKASGIRHPDPGAGILLAGLGHVLRIPRDLRANRLFHLAWLGQKERYVDGVNRAAVVLS